MRAILEDRNGNLWFGTEEGGVSKYDGQRFETFTKEHGLRHNEVRAILEDRSGNPWFGTRGGVSKYDGIGLQTFTSEDGLVDNEVNSMIEDREGDLWFGTWGGGICKYDGKIQHYLEQANSVFSAADSNGELWFTTTGSGVFNVKSQYREGYPEYKAIQCKVSADGILQRSFLN